MYLFTKTAIFFLLEKLKEPKCFIVVGEVRLILDLGLDITLIRRTCVCVWGWVGGVTVVALTYLAYLVKFLRGMAGVRRQTVNSITGAEWSRFHKCLYKTWCVSVAPGEVAPWAIIHVALYTREFYWWLEILLPKMNYIQFFP